MVRVLAVGVLVALAACKVGVEGAPCRVAGVAEDCPEGQACGTDFRCSERAAGCAPLHWDGSACVCPPNDGTEFVADPAGGSRAGADPHPNGRLEPAVCRFARLTDALAAAAAKAPASVVAHAAPGEVAVFGDLATGETLPLRVAENVTLRAETPGGARLRAAVDTPEIVKLQGAIDGFAIESTAATGAGIAVSCGPAGAAPRVESVTLDGGGLLATGIAVVAGPCGAPVEISGSTLTRCGGEGVVLTGADLAIEVRLLELEIADNGGTGLLVEDLDAASRLTISGCDVYGNGKLSARTYGPAPERSAGGVLVRQDESLEGRFFFDGNRVAANGGDQLAFETAGAWPLSSAREGKQETCGPISNTFACFDESTQHAVALAGAGTVDASYSVWPTSAWQDYVSARVTVERSPFCNGFGGMPVEPACPVP